MQFESKIERNFWLNSILSIIPDITIAIITAAYFDNSFVVFIFVLLGLQVLYLLIWIKNSAYDWVFFKYLGRKQLSNIILDYLKKNEYPEPDEFLKSSTSYFTNVVANESLPVDLRLKAAYELGSLNFPATVGQIQAAFRLSMAVEDAIEDYKSSFSK